MPNQSSKALRSNQFLLMKYSEYLTQADSRVDDQGLMKSIVQMVFDEIKASYKLDKNKLKDYTQTYLQILVRLSSSKRFAALLANANIFKLLYSTKYIQDP